MSQLQKITRSLFYLILIEDDILLGEDLSKIFTQELDGCEVSWATNIDGGLSMLNSIQKYDAAVSDIRLPRTNDPNEKPMAYHDIADRLRALGVRTIFVTGWGDSEDVKQFLLGRQLSDPSVVVIEKYGENWISSVCNHLRSLFIKLASERVTKSVDRFFVPSSEDSHRSGTARLFQLSASVNAYWNYLDNATRMKVGEHFVIQELSDSTRQLSLRD